MRFAPDPLKHYSIRAIRRNIGIYSQAILQFSTGLGMPSHLEVKPRRSAMVTALGPIHWPEVYPLGFNVGEVGGRGLTVVSAIDS